MPRPRDAGTIIGLVEAVLWTHSPMSLHRLSLELLLLSSPTLNFENYTSMPKAVHADFWTYSACSGRYCRPLSTVASLEI